MLKYGWNVSDKKTILEIFVWHVWAMFSFTKNIYHCKSTGGKQFSYHFFLICTLPKMWARSNAEVFDGKLYVMLYYYAAEEVSHKKRNSQKINWKVGEDIKGGRRIYTNMLHFVISFIFHIFITNLIHMFKQNAWKWHLWLHDLTLFLALPRQLYRWPCHWVSEWVSEWVSDHC